MSKAGKLLRSPGEFFRDLLVKRYPETLEQEGERYRSAKHALPSLEHHEFEAYPVTFPVDVVYTWVDGSDPTWLAKKASASATSHTLPPTSAAVTRFVSRGELKYSLRSLEMYAPWIRRVWLVTDGQVPFWLDTTHPKVRMVDHTEIIPAQYLPTFNSHVIEAHLHRIPDLAEHFLYFNDDVLLARPTSAEYFFAGNGNPHLFVTRSQIPPGPIQSSDSPATVAAKNARRLVQRHFGRELVFRFAHIVHPQLRSLNEDIVAQFEPEFLAFFSNRFRSSTDISLPSCLSPNFAYLSGRADLRRAKYVYCNVRSPSAIRAYRMLLATKNTPRAAYCMCLNEFDVKGRYDDERLYESTCFLQEYFPKPSSFEKVGEADK